MKGWLKRLLVACALLGAGGASAATVLDPSLRLTAEERYDDDLRLNDGLVGGQFMSKVTPRLGLDAKSERLTLGGFYAADLLVRHGSGKVSLDHRAGLAVQHLLSRRLRVDFTGQFYRVTDPTSLPRQGLAHSTSPALYGQGRLALADRLTERLDARVSYNFEAARVFEEGRAAGYAHTPSVELMYRGTRRLTLGLEYRYQGFVFGNEYADAHGAFGSLRYRLTRLTTLTVRGGPVFFRQQAEVGPSGVLPRAAVELMREGPKTDWGFVVGHDLVGASGFTNVVWADYASLMVTHRFTHQLQAHGAASYFRNGRAPDFDFFQARSAGLAQGYAVGAALDYQWTRSVMVQGSLDRVAQVGAVGPEAVDLTRNVAAVRFIYSAW